MVRIAKPTETSFMKRLIVLSSLMLIAGCMVGPDYHQPKTNMPDGWVGTTSQPTTQPTTRTSITTSEPTELREWWKTFHDATLDSLITRAIESNLDLQQAELRIRQARAARAVTAGGLWP